MAKRILIAGGVILILFACVLALSGIGWMFGWYVNNVAPPTANPPLVATEQSTTTCGRGGDEINYGSHGSPCETMSADVFVYLMTGGAPVGLDEQPLLRVYPQIRALDRAFEANTDIGMQFRNSNEYVINATPKGTRVLWLSTSWAEPVPDWMKRLSCDGTDPCIILVESEDDITVKWSGRGIILDRPLTQEEIAKILAYAMHGK